MGAVLAQASNTCAVSSVEAIVDEREIEVMLRDGLR